MKRKKVLVVDDDSFIYKTLKDILETEGYEVVVAASGRKALELVELNDFDIVLSDVVMEKIGGCELARHIQRVAPNVSLFFMTAYPRDKRVQEAKECGVLKVFTKPFDVQEMLAEFTKIP